MFIYMYILSYVCVWFYLFYGVFFSQYFTLFSFYLIRKEVGSLLENFHKPVSKLYQNQYVLYGSGTFFTGSSIILMLVYETVFPIGIYHSYHHHQNWKLFSICGLYWRKMFDSASPVHHYYPKFPTFYSKISTRKIMYLIDINNY